ncbi:OLC1v1025258C1 [Oldenlandia corymbosa var. corymbosa]|uniref:OLC1v1025258C1 n=1 Tax=Oldenlandia corymbosa var. corymbosa TaxID=529605 RepID=A0AAV1C6G1_OLDCO|nr:OLC1v1025258C1 [Oldenlandia corymbosa var. corymbosa]
MDNPDDSHGGGSSTNPTPAAEYVQGRKLEIEARILKPLVRSLLNWSKPDLKLKERLQRVDDVIHMVVEDLEEPAPESAKVRRVSSNLKSTHEDMERILSLCSENSKSYCTDSWNGAEHTLCFMDSVAQILQTVNQLGAEIFDEFVAAKQVLLDVCYELNFMEDLLWLIYVNPVRMNFGTCSYLSYFTEKIGVEILCMLYNCLMNKMDEALLVRFLNGKINSIRKEVKNYHESSYRDQWFPNSAAILDKRVVRFFDYLIEEMKKLLLHNTGDSFMLNTADGNEMEIVVQELSFIRWNLLDLLMLYLLEKDTVLIEEMNSLCFSTQNLIMDTGFLIFFFRLDDQRRRENQSSTWTDEDEDEKARANYWRFHLPGLLEHIDSLKQRADNLLSFCNKFFNPSSKSYGSTNQKESINGLINCLLCLKHPDEASTDALHTQVQSIYQEISSLKDFLPEVFEDHLSVKPPPPQFQFLRQQFEEAINKSNFIIHIILAGKGPLWYHKLGIFVVLNHVKVALKQMKAYSKKMVTSDPISTSISGPASLLSKNPKHDEMRDMKEESPDKLVGREDETMEVIEALTSIGATRLKSLAIVGMPGLGKTTLANSVYKHPSINAHFHVRAWCCASESYVKEALLFEILSQIVSRDNENIEITGEDLALKIYQNLKGRKYLVVIDDIWEVKLWNELKETFPDDHNGSRILFTTRNRAVALKINSIPYSLRLLSNEESCELLLLRVFNGRNYPEELSMISNRIARHCQGLPLAVILFAGILKRTERRKGSWEQVAKSVFSLHTEQVKCTEVMDFTNILEFSYNQLPDCLKRCFVYFGAFPEDSSISVSKLIRLWISEDFVHGLNLGLKSSKQEAEAYLCELIDRSLVMIAKMSSKGGVKACRVHDVLRQFCSKKLHSEMKFLGEDVFEKFSSFRGNLNALHAYNTYLYHYRSHPSTIHSRFHFQDVSNDLHFGPRLQHTDKKLSRYMPPVVREWLSEGLLMHTGNTKIKRFNYDMISYFLQLRVLDLGNVRVESSADTSDLVIIAELIHLRYLAIRPRRNELPPELGNLQYLETLALAGVIGYIFLPDTIWNLTSLRHLLSDHGIFIFPHVTEKSLNYYFQMDDLTHISTLPLYRGKNVGMFILRRLPSIQKLGCRFFSDSWDNYLGCNIFPELDFLSELKSLKISFSGKVQCPCKFSFPSNLVKLVISSSRLPWEEISVIGRLLPNLEVLKLLSKAFEGQQWDMKDGEFPKLKFLKLESLDIVVWNAEAPDYLPFLEQLVVLRCPNLQEIPASFGEIATLKSIEIKWCSSPAMDSVKNVLELQRDLSNDEFSVNLSSPLE